MCFPTKFLKFFPKLCNPRTRPDVNLYRFELAVSYPLKVYIFLFSIG